MPNCEWCKQNYGLETYPDAKHNVEECRAILKAIVDNPHAALTACEAKFKSISDERQQLLLQIRELEEKLSVISGAARCREFERDRAERLISEMKAEAERKDKMWEDATAKNLEALTELLEALGPFYLHGKALAEDGTPPLYCINRYGSSMLVMGAFNTAIDAYQKWQDLLDDKEQQTEKRK